MKDKVMEKIAGEITLSGHPGLTIRKWREYFGVSQVALAQHLGVSPSIICDYESGRRKSPGVNTVKRIVVALIEIDEEMGGHGMKRFSLTDKHDAIFSMREFSVGVVGTDFAKSLEAKVITGKDKLGKRIYGYTVIDSVRAILSFNASDYLRIYGWSSERALIFTGIRYGRSPMVAIRSHILKPAIVVYHRPDRIDELAIRLAEIEELPLIVTNLNLETMIKRLESM